MRLSELIEKLQEEIRVSGDLAIKGQCDELGGTGTFDVGEIGWYADENGQLYTTLICAECAHMSKLEKYTCG